MGGRWGPAGCDVMQRLLALVAVLALIVLHNDVWNREAQLEPVLGWMPADMVYRVVWVTVGAGVLWWVLRVTWRDAR